MGKRKQYRDDLGWIFANRVKFGQYAILYSENGAPVTRLDEDVHPIDSEFGARYEHPAGILLSRADVDKVGIPINGKHAGVVPAEPPAAALTSKVARAHTWAAPVIAADLVNAQRGGTPQKDSVTNSAMMAEWESWRQMCGHLKKHGIEVNAPGSNPLVRAIRLWGEELHGLRVAAVQDDTALLRDAREAYEPDRLADA